MWKRIDNILLFWVFCLLLLLAVSFWNAQPAHGRFKEGVEIPWSWHVQDLDFRHFRVYQPNSFGIKEVLVITNGKGGLAAVPLN